MRLSIRHTNYIAVVLFAIIVASLSFTGNANALDLSNQIAELTDEEKIIYSQNNIIFPTSNCITKGGSSSICGDTPEEMYWSALNKYIDDPVKAAGVMGNLAAEGSFNPTRWEIGYSAPWDRLYNCGDGNCPFGIGSFGFTWHLGKYLHAVNDENPDLLKYFQNRDEYDLEYADELMKKIGKDDFARLVEFEVKYAIETWEPETTQEYLNQKFSSPSDAAYWWMDRWERPDARTETVRRQAAEKAYDEFKNFSCTPTSSSTSTKSATTGINNDITLIGDSIAVQAEAELKNKFPGSFMSKVGSRHSTSKGACDGDEGGLDILKKIASGSGNVADQHSSGECSTVSINSDSLKDNVVWELGTNSTGADADTIKKVLNTIGQRKLFLVTPYNGEKKALADGIADLYRAIAEENDAVYIVDWNKAVRDDESKYIRRDDDMAVHPTSEGRQLLADLISEAVESTANCAIANYKDSTYKKRMEGLDTFNQWRGPWAQHPMCIGGLAPMDGHGCGVMSLAAMYYMFSGKGLNDEQVLNGLILATQADGYNVCTASAATKYGEKTKEYTGMTMETLWTDEGLFSYNDSRWDQFVDELKKGKKILISTTSPSCGGKSQFAGCAHFLYLDHYNAEKDAIYLYDPSMSTSRAAYGTEISPTGDLYDGVYVNKQAMRDYVAPDEAFSFTYYGQECEICEEDEAGLIAGGMTYEQAVEFVKPYREEASKLNVGDYGEGTANGTVIGSGLVSYVSGCASTLNNCVAFSQWFVNNYTTIRQDIGTNDGIGYVGTLINSGGLTDGGTTPRPYAVFSGPGSSAAGHTGVVLGINKNKNEIYIGEAACGGFYTGDNFNYPGVNTYSLDEYTNGSHVYAYTDEKLKLDKK
ncbi:hypothetical protein IKG10_00200 [Candidatus Saccharibacteria bacterium]|nr:hypothetical protein [Candidatus Saccharibacteria bacterium]